MDDSYVCSGAVMRCSFGDKKSKLTVFPSRTVWLTGQPQANISDHLSMKNIAPFGKCHTVSYPQTGSATAANHGKLTPMPCIPNTPTPWMNGKDNVLIKGEPALLKSSTCRCAWGGIIKIDFDGQNDQFKPYMPSTVGASGVEKQEWFCRIKAISFKYESRGKKKGSVLYRNNGYDREAISPTPSETESSIGVLSCGVSNDFGRYYVIANNDGVDIEVICDTNANSCNEENHKKVEIFAPDFPTNPDTIKETVRNKTEKTLTVYYYDIFYRSKEWGDAHPFNPAVRVVGDIVDFAAIFRYFLLPKLTSANTQFIYDLQYHDCYCNPNILLDVYPDVDFGVEIGVMGLSRNLEGGLKPKDITKFQDFTFDFSVKYGSVEKKFDYESYLSLEQKADNNLLYKTLKFIGRCFYETGYFAESLGNEVEGNALDKTSNSLANDLKVVGKADKTIGKTLVRTRQWLSGSFSIQPELSLRWRYDTSDDLRKLLRHIQLSLGIDCTGILKIDIVEIALKGVRKARTLTTVGAVGIAILTGGLATILAALVKLLVDVVATWLINKLKEGVKFNLILIGKVGVNALSYDSLRDAKVEGLTVAINPEIRLEIGLDVKSSITLFVVKASGAVGGSAETSSSMIWELKLNSKDGDLGVDHIMEISPFKLKIGVYALGGFEITTKKSKEYDLKESQTIDSSILKVTDGSSIGYDSKKQYSWSREWSFKKISCEIERWVFFKPDDNSN